MRLQLLLLFLGVIGFALGLPHPQDEGESEDKADDGAEDGAEEDEEYDVYDAVGDAEGNLSLRTVNTKSWANSDIPQLSTKNMKFPAQNTWRPGPIKS